MLFDLETGDSAKYALLPDNIPLWISPSCLPSSPTVRLCLSLLFLVWLSIFVLLTLVESSTSLPLLVCHSYFFLIADTIIDIMLVSSAQATNCVNLFSRVPFLLYWHFSDNTIKFMLFSVRASPYPCLIKSLSYCKGFRLLVLYFTTNCKSFW